MEALPVLGLDNCYGAMFILGMRAQLSPRYVHTRKQETDQRGTDQVRVARQVKERFARTGGRAQHHTLCSAPVSHLRVREA